MKLKLHHLIYAGIVIAVAVIFLKGGGAEKAIKRHLSVLEEQIEKSKGETGIALADRARTIGSAFSDPFTIALEPYGLEIKDRATLARHFAAYRQGTRAVEARFTDIDVALGPNERAATVVVDAVLTATWDDGQTGRERYRLRFDYVLIRGDWKIERLTLVEVLAGPERFL